MIAVALIERLARRGLLDADDIEAICGDISESDGDAVRAAYIEGVTPAHRPILRAIYGGKSGPKPA